MKGGENLNLNPFSETGEANKIIRLKEGIGYDGVLQSIEPGEDGYILANISSFIVELPEEFEGKLKPLLGQPVRVAFLLGRYHAAKMTRRA